MNAAQTEDNIPFPPADSWICYMEMALAEACLADALGEVPVGAVLVKNGAVIARGHNLRETNNDPTAHAEMICMREGAKMLGNWRLTGCTLFVTLEPCPMCAGALAMGQLSGCIYGASDPQKGCCGSVYDLPGDPAFQGATKWAGGVLATECKQLLAQFFLRRRGR